MKVLVDGRVEELKLVEDHKEITKELFKKDSSSMFAYNKAKEDAEDIYYLNVAKKKIEMSKATFEFFKAEIEFFQDAINTSNEINKWIEEHPEERENICRQIEEDDRRTLEDIAKDNRKTVAELTNKEIWEALFGDNYSAKDDDFMRALLNLRDSYK